MTKSPDQILAEGVANKERSKQDHPNPKQSVSVDETGGIHVSEAPDIFQDVKDFHKKFGISYDGPPRDLPTELKAFRDETESEEQREIRDAKDMNQHAELLDGYVDYIYFVLGRCHLHGWDFDEAWRRVHAKNMSKVPASDGTPSRRSQAYGMKFDIVKPPGWTPPDLTDLVTAKP